MLMDIPREQVVRIYSNYLAASLGFDILFLILTIEDA